MELQHQAHDHNNGHMVCGHVCRYLFAPQLDKIVIFGFPMGTTGAQGSLIVFVILIFVYALR